MAKKKACENCGVGNEVDALHCKNCGNKFQETVETKKTPNIPPPNNGNVEIQRVPTAYSQLPVDNDTGTVYDDVEFKKEVLNSLKRIEKALLG